MSEIVGQEVTVEAFAAERDLYQAARRAIVAALKRKGYRLHQMESTYTTKRLSDGRLQLTANGYGVPK